MASAKSGKMLSAEERRRQRELEEARKAGLAPAELDEEGKEINPHIPSFMADAPWYLNSSAPSLKHQKNWKDQVTDEMRWYDRGAKVFQAHKYRKGACENCGSISHKTKDCMERPRTKGAKLTNKNIAADDKIEDLQLKTFDAKRDRWNGYNGDEWVKQAERFEKVEAVRAEIRRKELLEKKLAGEVEEEEAEQELGKEESKIDETEDAGFAKVEKRVRTAGGGSTGSVRNLRIREDTAKYLLNLDTNSAYYDPKSRSMREDPQPDKDPSQKTFYGDNFVRQSGEVGGFTDLNAFAITTHERGHDVHMQAMPSQAELSFQQFKQRKKALEGAGKEGILAKYGNAAAAASDDVKALQATEAYAEYDASSRLLRGQEVKAKSRYEEDQYINNHTSVWGSWWHDGQWGYACCHSTVKQSYCVGAAGAEAAAEAAEQLAENMEKKAAEDEARRRDSKLVGHKPTADVWGEAGEDALTAQLDREKVMEAIRRQEEREKAGMAAVDDRKRGYNSLAADDAEVTPEEMEAYRLKKSRGMDDPLSFINKKKEKSKGKGGDGGGEEDGSGDDGQAGGGGGGGTGGYDYV
ncbi:Pre-mRNA-splicing factor SLU7 [Micractinium conductrix]|uniref:Pre-mRNA-splicing factor SLU7 n=1 Tax=Micractinium conductrix TaxID=554055 RepID=A0A2P6V7Y5_9CHLO|nr:Pre-mRNA-splicing factor SLU7 [Micractinium conductrix]|eukprot:PSC70199.1 Pre-mRNA-splicing factor SLU7 [Micractinium conductrix]